MRSWYFVRYFTPLSATTQDPLEKSLSICYYDRFRAGALGRENCSVKSLTDRWVSPLTPLPLSVPARVGAGVEDGDSSSVRKVEFISLGSDVSTLRVAKGLAPSIEDR